MKQLIKRIALCVGLAMSLANVSAAPAPGQVNAGAPDTAIAAIQTAAYQA